MCRWETIKYSCKRTSCRWLIVLPMSFAREAQQLKFIKEIMQIDMTDLEARDRFLEE